MSHLINGSSDFLSSQQANQSKPIVEKSNLIGALKKFTSEMKKNNKYLFER